MPKSGISIVTKGNHACFIIVNEDKEWQMIIDEKNLAKFILEAQHVLLDIRLK